MDKKLSFPNLYNVFKESLERQEPTLAFEIKNGRGRFLFIMFFDEEEHTKDQLFIFFKNTRRMVKLKLYGNHLKGQFDVYIKPYIEKWFIEELGIENKDNLHPFNFETFFTSLNQGIPQHLMQATKIDTLRDSWHEVKNDLPSDIVDERDKIYLKCPMILPKNKRPREKTLRKLYLYTDGNSKDIAELIENLKRMNTTVKWTDDEMFKGKTIDNIKDEI